MSCLLILLAFELHPLGLSPAQSQVFSDQALELYLSQGTLYN